jgi:DNA-binding CsgD family transcriptional regulator
MRTDINLAPRETQVAELLAWGASKKEVADRLDISVHTVENTARNIFSKIGIQKATELSVWWFCTKLNVSFDMSPLRRAVIAIFLLAAILPREILQTGHTVRVFRARTIHSARARRSRRDEGVVEFTSNLI